MNKEIIIIQLLMVFKVLIAAVFGGIIGFFRRKKRAGIRTIALISTGAALFTMISLEFTGGDPGRMAAGIVTGVGFIGAGVIWKEPKKIGGITTACTIWAATAVGICVAMEMWTLAVFSLILISLIIKSKLGKDHE